MRIAVNGTELYYRALGQGRPLILLHGNGESGRIFDQIVGPLARDYRVYAVDSRGHGQSSRGVPVDYRLMTQDIAQLIEELDLEKPALYGFSDGGIVGLMLASQYPDLLSCLAVSGANANPQGLRARWQLAYGVRAAFDPDPLAQMLARGPHITKQELGRIQIPVLATAGQYDAVREQHTRWLAQAIPGAQLAVVPGATHSSYIVHSKAIYGYLRDFLAECLQTAEGGDEA